MKNLKIILMLLVGLSLGNMLAYAACPADLEVSTMPDGRNRYGYYNWHWPYLKATDCTGHTDGPYQNAGAFESLKDVLLRAVSNDIRADEDAVRFADGYFDYTWLHGKKATGVPAYNASLTRGATFTTNASEDLKGVFQTIAHKIKIRLTR